MSLKNCPFCGGEPRIQQNIDGDSLIICPVCNIRTDFNAIEDCIEIWNTRVADNPLPCNVEDTVYKITYVPLSMGVKPFVVKPVKFSLKMLKEIGKTVFLTQEEAEEELNKWYKKGE